MRTVPLAVAAIAALAATPLRAQETTAAKAAGAGTKASAAEAKPLQGPPAGQPAEKTAEKPPEKKLAAASAGPDGFVLQNESGDFRLQLRGYVPPRCDVQVVPTASGGWDVRTVCNTTETVAISGTALGKDPRMMARATPNDDHVVVTLTVQ